MKLPLRVVCLDIEGGHGGSSRSLYEAIAALDRSLIAPEVWCRRDGPILGRYELIDVPVRLEPALPKVSALPRVSRNLFVMSVYCKDFASSADARRRLQQAAIERFDLVHFNHEAFAGLALWLRRQAAVPAVMHLRTNLTDTWFARAQQWAISRAVDQRVFITPNEEASYRRLGGRGAGRVIFNPAPLREDADPLPQIPRDEKLNVASLSNFSPGRGTDRLIDIARELGPTSPVRFIMAGDSGSGPGGLPTQAQNAGVAGSFVFLGHVSQPERVLAASDLLIKPTREANPWGRDILEAMAQGKPVLACGHDQTFVETGVTGILMEQFNARVAADHLLALATNRGALEQLGKAARPRIAALCDPHRQAAALADVWLETFRQKRGT